MTDPQARWTAAPGGPTLYAYSTNYLTDTEHGVIVDVKPTPAHRTVQVESTKTMIDRVEAQFDIKPERLIGNTTYGTAPMLACMVEENDTELHVPGRDKNERKNDSFRATISTGMKRWRSTATWPATHCTPNGAPSRMSVHTSPKPTPSSALGVDFTLRRCADGVRRCAGHVWRTGASIQMRCADALGGL